MSIQQRQVSQTFPLSAVPSLPCLSAYCNSHTFWLQWC